MALVLALVALTFVGYNTNWKLIPFRGCVIPVSVTCPSIAINITGKYCICCFAAGMIILMSTPISFVS